MMTSYMSKAQGKSDFSIHDPLRTRVVVYCRISGLQVHRCVKAVENQL